MGVTPYAAAVIFGCCLVTLLPRILPVMLLSKMKIPDGLSKWLKHVPVAVMTALLVNELMVENGTINLTVNFFELLVAVPTFIVAIKTKSPIFTVAVGVISLMVLRILF